jgi:hypothetical protein
MKRESGFTIEVHLNCAGVHGTTEALPRDKGSGHSWDANAGGRVGEGAAAMEVGLLQAAADANISGMGADDGVVALVLA